ncbi:unnamed protein product [Ectocarpus sp. CCAP 1310/34]|nr:unnamed protein product [Ectocarpus sp. CCAP 1310/34]
MNKRTLDETALCDSILQFADGQGLPVAGNSPYVSVPATGGSADAAAGELVDQTPFKIDNFGGPAEPNAATASTTTAIQQHLQKEGLMRAFVGTKLGEFNMRGVEAGMSWCHVEKKPGKVLNTQGRRQMRAELSGPYGEKGSSLRRGKTSGPGRQVVGDVRSGGFVEKNTKSGVPDSS